MKILKLTLFFLLFISLLAGSLSFIQQNSDTMTITFLNRTTEGSKWLVLLIAVLVGTVLASLFFVIELVLLQTRNVRLRRLNSKLERALSLQKSHATLDGPKVAVSTPLEEDV